jgi:hypothetical protein
MNPVFDGVGLFICETPMVTKYKKHFTFVLTWFLITNIFIFVMSFLYNQTNLYSPIILSDFIAYWSSGQLLLNGDNPYSWYQLLSKQQSAGWPFSMALMPYYPPWVFPFVFPFCMQNYAASKFLWFLFHLGLVFICTNWTWRLYDGPKQYSHIYLLLVFTFAPVLFMMANGQIVPLVLLGVLGFLHFEKKKNGWLAGCFLLLIAIKPHILYLFWMALLLWILERRKWSIMFGGVTATLTALLIPMIYNPDVINQYILLLSNYSPTYMWDTPTIGTLLRMLFKIDWIQYLPTLGGTLWFISYWMKHHKTWEWDQQMPSIIIVSLMTTPYLWRNDYAILILPMAQVAIRLIQENQSRFIILIVFLYLLVDVFALVLAMMTRIELHFVWMVPALFVIYLLVSKRSIFATGTIEERLRRHEHDIRDA